jgi:hypothetical protein
MLGSLGAGGSALAGGAAAGWVELAAGASPAAAVVAADLPAFPSFFAAMNFPSAPFGGVVLPAACSVARPFFRAAATWRSSRLTALS